MRPQRERVILQRAADTGATCPRVVPGGRAEVKPLRRHPTLLELSALPWIARLSERAGRRLSLSTVPDRYLAQIAERFDLVWMMGVWERSPAAAADARASPLVRTQLDSVLPGWRDEDVVGSPYAVRGYQLNPTLGHPFELGVLRRRLNELNVRMVVDFVGNHVARDHPWTLEHPDRFITSETEAKQRWPDGAFKTRRGTWIAHGRDPNFPPWSDTAQLDITAPQTQEALLKTLFDIAEAADGVRCDMAQLGLGDVFRGIWSWAIPPRDQEENELWRFLIDNVKAQHEDFLFLAEAYWGLEPRLLEQGFDFTYDKRLSDVLVRGSASELREHLSSISPTIEQRLWFTENHDEPRTVVALGRRRALSAATALLTLPGMRMLQSGQVLGHRLKVPIQLGREPPEPIDEAVRASYDRLIAVTARPVFHDARWTLVVAEPAELWDDSHRHLVVWTWEREEELRLVAINLSGAPAQAVVHSPQGRAWPLDTLLELVDDDARLHAPTEDGGLRLLLRPWGACLLGGHRSPQVGS